MEVKETLFSKSFSVENDDPYALSIQFMERLSEIGRIYERKNVYETDGPVKKYTVVFDLVEVLDRFSCVVINFSLEAENKTLYVDILGEFALRIQDCGFFTEVFMDFYLNNIFPVLRKVSDRRIKELDQHLENAL